MTPTLEISVSDTVIAEAELCRRQAASMASNDPRFSGLVGQPSAWCVVTQKGFWSREFHTPREKDRLHECLEKGHRVVLTVGLVSRPEVPLHAYQIRIRGSDSRPSETLGR